MTIPQVIADRLAGVVLAPQPPAHLLAHWQAALPPGQYRAAEAWVGAPTCRTCTQAAAQLRVSANTLKTQLRRIRTQHPLVWVEVLAFRGAQRAERHAAAVRRAERHSTRWHRKQFYLQYGYWPRERRRR